MTLTGGKMLDEHLRKIISQLDKAGSVRVGFLENATYPNGTLVAAAAVFNEFGVPSRNQPPRPYFRQMIDNKSPGWAVSMGKIAVAADYDMQKTFGRMGQLIKGQLQKSINDLVTPPLAESTIEKKGFAKPLIDTSQMLNSVDYEVQ